MTRPGSPERPLRVAVIGSGPAGFYVVQHLFKSDARVQVDMFERLPTPFGLVRHGVAPDHPKIKSVAAVYHKLAVRAGFRFFGQVEYGRDLTLADLSEHFDQAVFCTGAQTDRRLGIPGEDLARSHPATEFVAWYNGHPDFSRLRFDLSQERAVVVGVGNVAIDVARILCRTPDELVRTDIADYALDALARSRVREVYLLGRRGPAQAAFTNPEIKELGELAGAVASTVAGEVRLDDLSRRAVDASGDKAAVRKVELLASYADREDASKAKKLRIRFLVSPLELLPDADGGVRAVRVERNELRPSADGNLRPRGTGAEEIVEAGLVFRSVGYRGVALAGLPFREDWGVVPNDRGRIVDPDGNGALAGLYASGWIKRGPSGVIGTNKPDAQETVACMLEDLAAGRLLHPSQPEPAAVESLLRSRGLRFVTYEDWLRIDAWELDRGRAAGRPRLKLTNGEQLAEALRS